jgi:hypothetical protein
VIDALGASLEDRRDDRHLALGGELRQRLGALAGNRFGEVEVPRVFALAEVAGAEQLGQAGQARAARGRGIELLESAGEVGGRVFLHPHLDESDPERLRHVGSGRPAAGTRQERV